MTINVDRRLSAKETAELVGLSVTNLKHYASLLEFNGLEIHRNTRNHREYTQHDAKILQAMVKLNRDKSMNLEDAASKVMSADTDLDLIMSLNDAKNDAKEPEVIRVYAHDSEKDIRDIAHVRNDLALALSQLNQVYMELKARDQQRLEYMQSFESTLKEQADRITEQSKAIEEQSKAIAEQSATIAELHKRLDEAASKKPSLWARLFGSK